MHLLGVCILCTFVYMGLYVCVYIVSLCMCAPAFVHMCVFVCTAVYTRVLRVCPTCVKSYERESLSCFFPPTPCLYVCRSRLMPHRGISRKKNYPPPSQIIIKRTLSWRDQASGEATGLHDVAWISNPFSPYTPGDAPRLDIGVGLGVSDSVPSLSDEDARGEDRTGARLRVRRSRSRVAL